MMDLFAWFARGEGQFVNGCKATVLRRYCVARQLAVPKCQQIQPRKSKVLTAPCDINADDINFSLVHLGEAGDHVDEVLKSAHIAGVGIVHPTVDVNEKERTLRLPNHIDCSRSLRHI